MSRKENTRDPMGLSERKWKLMADWVLPANGGPPQPLTVVIGPRLEPGERIEVVPAPTEGAVVTDELLARACAAYYRAAGYWPAQVDMKAALRAALEVTDDQ